MTTNAPDDPVPETNGHPAPANPPQPGPQHPYPQPPYGQAPYPPPQYPVGPESTPRPTGGNGLGITALVTGILGLVLIWVPDVGIVLGILATTFGGLALYKALKGTASNKGVAIAGLVLGIITVVLTAIFIIVAAASTSSTT